MTEMEFFSISCEQLQIDYINNGYARFIYNNYTFYTDKRYFTHPQWFPTSSSQGRLYIMAHQLADGSYWIHWMKLVQKATQKNKKKKTTLLQPYTIPNVTPANRKSSRFYGLGFLLFISIILYHFIYMEQGNAFTLITSILLATLFLFVYLSRRDKVKRLSNKNVQSLNQWIEKAKRKKAGEFLAIEGRQAPRDVASRLQQFISQRPEGLELVEGTIEVISTIKTERDSILSSHTNFHDQINLACAGRYFNFLWQSTGVFYGTDPILWQDHAPFIANNDRVVFFYREIHYIQPEKLLKELSVQSPDLFINNNIFYLYNKTDNSLYRGLLTVDYKIPDDKYFSEIPLQYQYLIPTHE